MRSDAEKPLNPPPRRLGRADFIARYGSIYESSPWIAEAAWEAGLTEKEDRVEGFHRVLKAVVSEASREAKLRLIRAHPDLAGRSAALGELSPSSKQEQASAGLDRCSPEQIRRLGDLNAAYKARFGFPFIIAVKGKRADEIIETFEHRLNNDPTSEFESALEQIHLIALYRLRDMAEAD